MSAVAKLHVVAIAGGSGTRFWPVSRTAMPKQLLKLGSADTLLGSTFKRVASLAPPERWWMVVGASHADACRAAAPEVPATQVLVEPQARNTAPAIALAAIHVLHRDPKALMAVLPADHHVQDERAFAEALRVAAELAAHGPIVTLGVRPARPETGYGYIERGLPDPRVDGAFRVQRFREKPNLQQAEAFLAQEVFLWNAGIFVMRPQSYLAEVERQQRAIDRAMHRLVPTIGTSKYAPALAEAYASSPSISIDYGVMEGAREVGVVPVSCGWSDVGSWAALGSIVEPDESGNVVVGRAVAIESKDCVVYASDGHVVAVVGMKNVAVVHTPDAALVVPLERAQDVRGVIEQLKARGWQAHL